MFIPNLCWNIFNYTNSDKTPFTWCGIPKAVYSALLFFIGWYTLWYLNFLHFLSIRMLDLKSTVEIYVDVSTVENWLFCRLSCMLNKYSGNYWKNFKYKVTSIASIRAKSLLQTVIIGAMWDVIYSICAQSMRRHEIKKQYGIFKIFLLLFTSKWLWLVFNHKNFWPPKLVW